MDRTFAGNMDGASTCSKRVSLIDTLRSRRQAFCLSKVLLEHGAAIEVSGHSGWTPLHVAARKGYMFIVKVVLPHVEHSPKILVA